VPPRGPPGLAATQPTHPVLPVPRACRRTRPIRNPGHVMFAAYRNHSLVTVSREASGPAAIPANLRRTRRHTTCQRRGSHCRLKCGRSTQSLLLLDSASVCACVLSLHHRLRPELEPTPL